MPLCATMRFALRDLQGIVIFKHFVLLNDRQNDLVESLAEILGSFLGNFRMLGFKLRRFISQRSYSSVFYDLPVICEVVDIS